MWKKPYRLSKRVTILEMEISDGYLDAVKNLVSRHEILDELDICSYLQRYVFIKYYN